MEVPISKRDQAEGLPPHNSTCMEVPISKRDQAEGLPPRKSTCMEVQISELDTNSYKIKNQISVIRHLTPPNYPQCLAIIQISI